MPRKATVLKTAAFTSSATSALKGVEVMGFEPTARDFRTALSHTAKVSYCNGKNAMLTHGWQSKYYLWPRPSPSVETCNLVGVSFFAPGNGRPSGDRPHTILAPHLV
jgi:hypothetical protein